MQPIIAQNAMKKKNSAYYRCESKAIPLDAILEQNKIIFLVRVTIIDMENKVENQQPKIDSNLHKSSICGHNIRWLKEKSHGWK